MFIKHFCTVLNGRKKTKTNKKTQKASASFIAPNGTLMGTKKKSELDELCFAIKQSNDVNTSYLAAKLKRLWLVIKC